MSIYGNEWAEHAGDHDAATSEKDHVDEAEAALPPESDHPFVELIHL